MPGTLLYYFLNPSVIKLPIPLFVQFDFSLCLKIQAIFGLSVPLLLLQFSKIIKVLFVING
jgi:hypothetical protein